MRSLGWVRHSLAASLLCTSACGTLDFAASAQSGGSGGQQSGGAGGNAASEPGQREFERIRDRFGPLQTLAGSGTKGGDTNDWAPSFEGGPALAADLSTPHNALGDAEGNTFIADKDAHAIRKVDPDGVISTVAGMNEAGDDGNEPAPGVASHLNQPNGLWVKADSTLFILDLGNRKVRRLAPDGTLETLFAVPELATGRGLWVADDESLAYVCSRDELFRWTPAAGVELHAFGFGELGNLFVGDGGALFVTDRAANRVVRVDADGTKTAIAGSGSVSGPIDRTPAIETPLDGVRGIWGSAEGGFFVATHEGSQVLYLDSFGFSHVLLDGAPDAHAGDGLLLSTPGVKVSEVRNVTVNPQGDLLITENDVGFIRVARRDP